MLYTRVVPRLEWQAPGEATAGWCVLKVTTPKIVIADVTTCSVAARPRDQPFFAASCVVVGVVLPVMANSEFVQMMAVPQSAVPGHVAAAVAGLSLNEKKRLATAAVAA